MKKFVFIWDTGEIEHIVAYNLEDAYDALPLELVRSGRKFQAIVFHHKFLQSDINNPNTRYSKAVEWYGNVREPKAV